jgi:hypothetical protein
MMELKKMFNWLCLALAIIAFTGCDSSPEFLSEVEKNPVPDKIEYSTEREEIDSNGHIDFEGGNEVFFSFSKGEMVEVDQNDNKWDLKFSGWEILTNGGISGKHSGGGTYISSESYESIGARDIPGMIMRDSYGGVFDEWYHADMVDSFTITSKRWVYFIKTSESVYKFTVLSYHGDIQGAPVSAVYSISYSDMDSPDDVITVSGIDATAGGTSAKGDGAYFSFKDGIIIGLDDKSAQLSTDWDIKFKRFNINLNGGVSGPGSVKGYKTEETDFDKVDINDIPPDEDFEYDRVRPVIDRWAKTGNDGEISYADIYYVILTGDGKNWYKFYPLSVEGHSEGGYERLDFRFDKIR